MNSTYCHCEIDEDNNNITIEIINKIIKKNYIRILNNEDIENIEFIYNNEQNLIKKKILEDGNEEIQIIKIHNPKIHNIANLYNLIQNKNFKISLFNDFAVIENQKPIGFNIIIKNVKNVKYNVYEINYYDKMDYFILNGYKEFHNYKKFVYTTCYLKNFIIIELIYNNIKYVKKIFETDLDNIFNFDKHSLYNYYLVLLYYIKSNKVMVLEFEESNQFEIIFDKNSNYHIFLNSDKSNKKELVECNKNDKNKNLIEKIEEDLEDFRNYLYENKSDNIKLIEIERKMNYRINKLKSDNDYVFL